MDVQPPLVDDYIYLTGRPSIREFIGFARRDKVNGRRAERERLIREWQQAQDHLRELEKSEKASRTTRSSARSRMT